MNEQSNAAETGPKQADNDTTDSNQTTTSKAESKSETIITKGTSRPDLANPILESQNSEEYDSISKIVGNFSPCPEYLRKEMRCQLIIRLLEEVNIIVHLTDSASPFSE